MTRTPLRMRVERPSVTDYTTVGNDYVDVPFAKEGSTDTRVYWDAWHLAGVKILHFFAATKDLKVQILGSLDGTNFDTTLFAEFTLTAGSSSPVEKRIVAYWPYIKVQVKPSASSQHGTLTVRAIGTTVSGESDTEVTATIDPGTLATESTLSSIKTAVEGATPAGGNSIGSTKDNGPAWTVTRTYTTGADMTTAAAISPAASAGMKLVADDILVSAAVAMEFSIQQENEATVFASVFIPANGTVQITMRDGLKTATAVRKFFGKASVAGNVRITCCTHEEA